MQLNIMQISEDALFSTLAQINQNNKRKGAKRFIPDESIALVKKTTETFSKVDRVFELEKQIISILLTYGNQEFDNLAFRLYGPLIESLKNN